MEHVGDRMERTFDVDRVRESQAEVILFILLSPGLLFQVHGADKFIQFGNFETSATSIFLHSLIFFALFCLFTLVLHLHIYV
ncbi:hypothetical protein SDJN02_10284 [Cucurbita argyrosperma subsp. argyrosperma]|nr:hypothetical protein SDJN02_10284 [Cucurbita argyrosperma subsp. argyrosperma]